MDMPKKTIVMIEPEEYKKKKAKKDRQDIKKMAYTHPAPSATEGWKAGQGYDFGSGLDWLANAVIWGVGMIIVFGVLIAILGSIR